MDHLKSGVRDQPGQHGETLSLFKKQANKQTTTKTQQNIQGLKTITKPKVLISKSKKIEVLQRTIF